MKINLYLSAIIVAVMSFSCSKEDNEPSSQPTVTGTYVINEGSFGSNNASVSFISDEREVLANVFQEANQRPLGDVFQSVQSKGNEYFLIVNNSGKIERVTQSNLKSNASIIGLNSPRYMAINNNTAYVSNAEFNSAASSTIDIIDLSNNSKTGSISVKGWIEEMEILGGTMYAASPNQNMVLIVNVLTNEISDTILTNAEPMSMVIDKNNKLWILCTGGYTGTEKAALHCYDPISNKVTLTMEFDDLNAYPTKLTINESRDQLYFLNNSVFTLKVDETNLPVSALIDPGTGQYFYGLGIEPKTDNIFVADAGNFSSNGKVLIYGSDTELVEMLDAGIAPSGFVFKR